MYEEREEAGRALSAERVAIYGCIVNLSAPGTDAGAREVYSAHECLELRTLDSTLSSNLPQQLNFLGAGAGGLRQALELQHAPMQPHCAP